ncbi:MAG: hypothetical protein KatS3mg097_587 [Candidatus Parcubacteria bacterium]|nr:MAG: hypothetical protein KatS3mg097_587 [Candidatus Parcubacteria bacterium]
MKTIDIKKIFLVAILALNLYLPNIAFVNAQIYSSNCPLQSQYDANSAILVGEVRDTGGDSWLTVWFEWGTSLSLGNFTNQQSIYVSNVPYRFCANITNLTPCTTYYYRAMVRNSNYTNQGDTYSFTTRCDYVNYQQLNVLCYAMPNNVAVNNLVTFYSNVTGGIGSYNYSWSGACSGNSATCYRSFSSPGNYVANLTVTSGFQSKTVSCNVNVYQPSNVIPVITSTVTNKPPVPIIAFSPKNIRPGTNVTFDASQSYDPDGYIVNYEWRINNKLVSRNVSFSKTLFSGNYIIKLTVKDNNNLSSSKEILLSIGKNVYITRTITKTIPVGYNGRVNLAQTANIDILLEPRYQLIKSCDRDKIDFTVINNTNNYKNINLTVLDDYKFWFNPQKRTISLSPNSSQVVSWKVAVPCYIEPGDYPITLQMSVDGKKKNFNTILSVNERSNFFLSLSAFFTSGQFFWLPLIILIILIIINIILWYRFFLRRKRIEKNNLLNNVITSK